MGRLIFLIILLLFESCNDSDLIERNQLNNILIPKPILIFPENNSVNIAKDSNIYIKFTSELSKNIQVELLENGENLNYVTAEVNGNTVNILHPVFNDNSKITVKINLGTVIIQCYSNCDTVENNYEFKYFVGNSYTDEPLKVKEINDKLTENIIPDFYELIFSKALSKETLNSLKYFNNTSQIYLEDSSSIKIYNNFFSVPFFISDIYGKKLTDSINVKFNKPCYYISQVCVTPYKDWSDSKGGDHIPFNEIWGYGSVNSTDQFVELTYSCENSRSIEYSYIAICDYSCDYYAVNNSKYVSYLGTGDFNTSYKGDKIVLGDPPGTIEEGDKIYLYSNTGKLLDYIKLPESFSSQGSWKRDLFSLKLYGSSCELP